jgi:hypothetical protein
MNISIFSAADLKSLIESMDQHPLGAVLLLLFVVAGYLAVRFTKPPRGRK